MSESVESEEGVLTMGESKVFERQPPSVIQSVKCLLDVGHDFHPVSGYDYCAYCGKTVERRE